jgi:hypothetical protein
MGGATRCGTLENIWNCENIYVAGTNTLWNWSDRLIRNELRPAGADTPRAAWQFLLTKGTAMPSLPKSRPGKYPFSPLVPLNGEPVTLAEHIDFEARASRDRGDEIGNFIADHLDRLCQLVLWTGATTPEEHVDRMDVWDSEIAARHYDRGYEDGIQAARREYGLRHGFPID